MVTEENSRKKSGASSAPYLQKGQRVWLLYKDIFAAARLVDRNQQTGRCRLLLEYDNREVEVGDEDIETANPSSQDRIEDICRLSFLNESSILHVLRQRYGSNLIHTFAGSALVAINPMAPLRIYSENIMQKFYGCRQGDLAPHIFATAQMALHALETTRQSQIICLLGRSGSGKTVNARHLIRYIVAAASSNSTQHRGGTPSVGENRLVTKEKLEAMWSLLDSFTCARTLANTQASRCAKLTTVELASGCSQPVTGLHVQIFLLERTRIVRRPEGEPAFHIFYYLLAGIGEKERQELFLSDKYDTNLFLTPLQRADDREPAVKAWENILSSLSQLKISQTEWNTVCKLLAVIYHLGAIPIDKRTTLHGQINCHKLIENSLPGKRAANLLGISPEELSKSILERATDISSVGKDISQANGREKEVMNVPVLELLEGFVTGLYLEVIVIVQFLINRSMSNGQRATHTISVLDPPGFQHAASCGRSSGATFEDLCYNYAQERFSLLSHTLNFTSQKEKYQQENIKCDVFDTIESSPKQVISLIDKNTETEKHHPGNYRNEEKGILAILDEEAITGTDEAFAKHIYHLYQQHKHQVKDRDARILRRVGKNGNFILSHCSGSTKVQYNPKSWLKNCREYSTSKNANIILNKSQNGTIRDLVTDASSLGQTIRRYGKVGPNLFRYKSVSSQVKFQMDFLVDLIQRSGRVHFVYCLLPVPNAGLCSLVESPLAPKVSETNSQSVQIPLLRQQLRAYQIEEVALCYKQGFPEQIIFRDFRRRFGGLVDESENEKSDQLNDRKHVEQMIEKLEIDPSFYRMGNTQAFFRQGVINDLDNQRNEKFSHQIIQFQAYCRGYLARKKVEKLRIETAAIECIQRNSEVYIDMKNWSWGQLYYQLRPLVQQKLGQQQPVPEALISNLQNRLQHMERERNFYRSECEKMKLQLDELTSEIREQHEATSDTREHYEDEREQRLKLQRELDDLKFQLSFIEKSKEEAEYNLSQAKIREQQQILKLGSKESEEDLAADVDVYKDLLRSANQEIDQLKRTLQNKEALISEDERDIRRQLEKKLADYSANNEEIQNDLSETKKRLSKCQRELTDMRLQSEENVSKNTELERQQKKLDAEKARLTASQSESQAALETVEEEKVILLNEKDKIERQLKECQGQLKQESDKVKRLNFELEELTKSGLSNPESELNLKILKLEQRIIELEEENGDLGKQIRHLEQERERSLFLIQKLKNQSATDAEMKEQELDQLKSNMNRRVNQLENQLEEEKADKQSAVNDKRAADRQLSELLAKERDPEIERKLRKELKRTKALLKENELLLEQFKSQSEEKTLMKNLKDELEAVQIQKENAERQKRNLETERDELQGQVDILTREKQEAADRYTSLVKECRELQEKFEDKEEENIEFERKYKNLLSKEESEKVALMTQNKDLNEIVQEKEKLIRDLSENQNKHQFAQEDHVNRSQLLKYENRIRELEGRIDLEISAKNRIEKNVEKCKEQIDALQQEKDLYSTGEASEKDKVRRLNRQLRDVKQENEDLELRLVESEKRKTELTTRLEELQQDYSSIQGDLKNAIKKRNELQSIVDYMEDDSSDDMDDDERASQIISQADETLRIFNASPRTSISLAQSTPNLTSLPDNSSLTTSPFEFNNSKKPPPLKPKPQILPKPNSTLSLDSSTKPKFPQLIESRSQSLRALKVQKKGRVQDSGSDIDN